MAVRSLPEYHSTNAAYYYVENVEQFVQGVLYEMPELIAVDTETYFDEAASQNPNVITKFIKGTPNNMPFGVSMFWGDKGYWIDKDLHLLKPILEHPDINKIFHNAKYDMNMFLNIGIEVCGYVWDTCIMMKLIDEEFLCKYVDEHGEIKFKKSNKLKDLAFHFLNGDAHVLEDLVDEYRAIIARNTGRSKDTVSYKEVSDSNHELMKDYAVADTEFCYKLQPIMLPMLKEQDLLDAYDIDIKATYAVIDIERNGIRVDVELMRQDEALLTEIIGNALHDVADLLGIPRKNNPDDYEFNLDSDAELVTMFEKLGIGVGGWSWFTDKGELRTDKKVMKELQLSDNKDIAKLAECVLTFRKASKIKNTYITGILQYVQNDGKVHPDFWISPDDFDRGGTKTGRMSSSNPNFQNIPKKPVEFKEDEEDEYGV